MKPWHIIVLIISLVAMLNMITWYASGRESILLNAAMINEETCPALFTDTIYVHAQFYADTEMDKWSSVSDFSIETRERLLEALVLQNHFNESIYSDLVVDVLDLQNDSLRLGAFVNRRIPIYASTSIFLSHASSVAVWDQSWIWIFGWRRLGDGISACS